MNGKEMFDAAGTSLAEEISRILGQPLNKTAAAKGTPEEGKRGLAKKAGITKISEMSLRSLLEHPDFVKGMQDEMEELRGIWEPVVNEFVMSNLGR